MKQVVPWFGAAALLLVIFGTIYTVTQQAQRSSANYLQIQLAEDNAALLNSGVNPAEVTTDQVNMQSSLDPFIIIYDKAGRAVGGAGSGFLDNKRPAVPYGVLTAANDTEYHAVTWQPAAGVRIAAVTVAAKNYYVLSGRNMREVEKSESRTLVLTAFGFLAALALLMATWTVQSRLPGRP
jgi:hypothetical protein